MARARPGLRRLAVVGGTALPQAALDGAAHALDTPFGSPSAPLRRALWHGRRVWFLHRHGDAGIAPHAINYRANLWALRAAGARSVIAVNAVGGIDERMAPSRWTVPEQLIDYTWGRAHSFAGDPRAAGVAVPAHCDFAAPYSPELTRPLRQALASALGQPDIPGCVYGCTQGPRLETAAEIARLRRDGCDVVGMTGMPEAALARELDLRYASLCLVVNRAGVAEASMASIAATVREAQSEIDAVFAAALA